jgi:putative peptidoglycan lipid II flippase
MTPAAGARRRAVPPAVAMASGTLASRTTGLMRTAGIASVLGVGLLSDAFTAASVVPTMLLVLITGGTLSSALVPMLSRPDDPAAQQRAAGAALLALSAIAALGSLLMAVAAPALSRFLSLGARGQSDYEDRVWLITVLLVLVAPQVLLLAVTAVTSAVLTARGRLGVVGWSPVATNVAFLGALVAFAVIYGRRPDDDLPVGALVLLGLGSTAAAAVGCLVQLRAAARSLPPLRTLRRVRDPGLLRELRRTGGWTLLYAVCNQVGLLVVLAAAARRNGVGSAYQWSFTVMQLPFALVGVTLLSATLPALARAAEDRPRFNRLVQDACVPLLGLLVPCAAALALFAPLLARLLVGHGAADATGTDLVARGIAVFAVALVPFAAYQLLTRSCYATMRPAWPALSNIAVNVVTVVGALLALRPTSAQGVLTVLAISYAASYVLGTALLGVALARVGIAVAAGVARPLVKTAVSTGAATVAVLVLGTSVPASPLRDLACVVAFAAMTAPAALPHLKRAVWARSRTAEVPAAALHSGIGPRPRG